MTISGISEEKLESEVKLDSIASLKEEIEQSNNPNYGGQAAGLGTEVATGLALDAKYAYLLGGGPVGWLTYAGIQAGGGAAANIAAQKLRGEEDLDWGEVISSGLLGIIPFTSLRFSKKATRLIGEAGTFQRAVTGGAGMGVADRFIQSGITEGEFPTPSEIAIGGVTGAAFGGTLQQIGKTVVSKSLSKQIQKAQKEGRTEDVAKLVWKLQRAQNNPSVAGFDRYEDYVKYKTKQRMQGYELKNDISNSNNSSLTPGGYGFYRPIRTETLEGPGKLYRQRTWKKLNEIKNLDDVPIQVQILDTIEELDDHIQRSIEIQDRKFDPRRPLKNYTGNRTRIFKYNDNGKIREIGLRWRNIRGKGFEGEITDAGWQIYDHTKARARVAKRFAWNQVKPGSPRIRSRQVFNSRREAREMGEQLLDSLAGSTNPGDVDLYHRIVGGTGKWYIEHINPQNSAVWQKAGDGYFYHKFKQGVTPKHPSNLRLMGDEVFMKMKNSLEAMMDSQFAADGRLYRDAYWLDMDPQGNLLVKSMDTGDLVSSDKIWRNLSSAEAEQQFKNIIAGKPTLPQPKVPEVDAFNQFTKDMLEDDYGSSYRQMSEIDAEIKRLTNLLNKWIEKQSRRTNPTMKRRDQSIIDDYRLEIRELENRKFDIKR